MQEDAIAVTAYGAVTALGAGVQALWHGLLEGRRPFAKVEAFGVNGCRAQLAAEVKVPIPEVGADRSAGLAVLAASEALSARTIDPRCQRIGMVIGSAGAGAPVLERKLQDPSSVPADWWRRYQKRWLADVIAPELGLEVGPTAVINTACSSATVAIAIGCDWLRAGECDAVLAIGTDELARFTYTGFNALRALDREPCRPFDKNRRGMSMGEGAGCLVLEPAHTAQRRGVPICGYVVGVGLACDAHHLTAPDPEGGGAARALMRALRSAQLEPEAIGFVNAHGTGTPLNDAAEVASLECALLAHARTCPVHSVKATTGHCMGAAGAIEAIVALQSLREGIVPATAGLLESDFEGRVNCVQGAPLSVVAEYAVSTNFGFGGNDAALVFAHA